MKRTMLQSFLLLVLINTACNTGVHYLDEDYPGLTPRLYAPGIINVEGRHQQGMTMSPDGREHLFGLTESEIWRYRTIIRVRSNMRNEIVVDTPQFVKDFKYERAPVSFIGCAMISPDNQRLYFIADYPPDYYYANRTSTGDWSEPVRMDAISTETGDWYISVTNNNILYFNDTSIYCSTPDNQGAYTEKLPVKGAFNEEDAGDPCISPKGDYMVFPSTRESGYGQGDLYVAFKNEEGDWSEAYNLGNEINTEDFEGAAYISPDEKFLFFTRREFWRNAGYTNIYWVSIDVINNIRNEMLRE